MAQARKDENRVSSILGTSNADGVTPVVVLADPSAHSLSVSDGTTGSDAGGSNANRDNNRVTTWIAVSSVDGITPVDVYADPATGELLVQIT